MAGSEVEARGDAAFLQNAGLFCRMIYSWPDRTRWTAGRRHPDRAARRTVGRQVRALRSERLFFPEAEKPVFRGGYRDLEHAIGEHGFRCDPGPATA